MAENYVNVQLTINGYRTYYWESERGAEIDFVIQRDGQLIPIEVKSADNTRAKSLKVYMDTYKPAYAIKLSAKNFGFEDNKKIVPLYAAFCIWNQYCNDNAHRYKCQWKSLPVRVNYYNSVYNNLLHEIVKYHKSGMLVHLNQHAALFMSYTLIHIRIIIFTDQCP